MFLAIRNNFFMLFRSNTLRRMFTTGLLSCVTTELEEVKV